MGFPELVLTNSNFPTKAMFLGHYGLRENPFGVTPDPRFLYNSGTHREAQASLMYGIESGVAFQALIAEPGMGKTTLLFNLVEHYRQIARTAFLFQTQCDSREFLRYLLSELGAGSKERDFVSMHEKFNHILLSAFRADKRVIVVIDEAQNLDFSVLETVRLLSDFETARVKLVQIVLGGQPQLAQKLASPELTQLRQRISIVSRIAALDQNEVESYVRYRLELSGYRGAELFTDGAFAIIASCSSGIPRNINTLCFGALTLGCALERKIIDTDIMQEVVADISIESMLPHQGSARSAPAPMVGRLAIEGDPTLEYVLEEAQNAVDATGAAIALISGSKMVCCATRGETAPRLGVSIDAQAGLSGLCVSPGKSLQCDDTQKDSRVDAGVCRRLGIRSLIVIPLLKEKKVVGMLMVSSARPRAFQKRDVGKLQSLGDLILKSTRCFSAEEHRVLQMNPRNAADTG